MVHRICISVAVLFNGKLAPLRYRATSSWTGPVLQPMIWVDRPRAYHNHEPMALTLFVRLIAKQCSTHAAPPQHDVV